MKPEVGFNLCDFHSEPQALMSISMLLSVASPHDLYDEFKIATLTNSPEKPKVLTLSDCRGS